VHSSADLPIGTRVEILEPDYVAGAIGIVLGREELIDADLTDRWLIKVVGEDIILSLSPDEFRVID
jgi:hypothetical protein